MKKFTCLPTGKILPIILLLITVFFLPPKADAQVNVDCRKIFDKESYKCLTDSNACSDACMKETEKPDGSAYFNSGEIYQKCMKASDCEGKSSACGDKALANFRACNKGESRKEEELIQPAEPWTSIKFMTDEMRQKSQEINQWIEENLGEFETKRIEEKRFDLEIYGRTPQITEAIIKQAQEEWKKLNEQVWSEPESEYIWQDEWPDDIKSEPWSNNSGAIIRSPSWALMYLEETKKLAPNGTTTRTLTLKGKEGEVEVKITNENPAQNKFRVQTNSVRVVAPRTHFWVSQNSDKNQTVVGIYEGEVQITTKDGKTTSLLPDGDKPGVVVVVQKLSVVKFAIAGVILAIILGGALLVIKRKILAKPSSSRKR